MYAEYGVRAVALSPGERWMSLEGASLEVFTPGHGELHSVKPVRITA